MALVKTEVTQAVVDYRARHACQDEALARVARTTSASGSSTRSTIE
jgi:hypothetical protein